jgi:hypothetical protein
VIKCLTHDQNYKTTYHNYERSKFGMPCCSSLKGKVRPHEVKQKIAETLQGKKKHYTSWLKGRKGQDHPSYKHGKGNVRASNIDELEKLIHWKQVVLERFNYKCFITGLVTTPEDPLVIHHLDSWHNNVSRRYDVNNGVVLLKSIHWFFHNQYGFGNNTALQFQMFSTENYDIQIFPWKYGNHEPSFTYNEFKKRIVTKEQQTKTFINTLSNSRGHKVLHGIYEHHKSQLRVYCTHHDVTYDTNVYNYKRSKFGMPCCARVKQSFAVSEANRKRFDKI